MKTAYDGAGRVFTLSGTKGGVTTTYASQLHYASHGAIDKLMLGNGLCEHTSFNSRLQPVEIGLGLSSGDWSQLRLTYDYGSVTQNNRNLQSQTIKVEGATPSQLVLNLKQSYMYDELNRLLSAREVNQLSNNGQTFKQTFTYTDEQGNGGQYGNRRLDWEATTENVRPIDQTQNPEISSANNRITTAGYAYDGAGNMKNAPGHAYQFDAENRMVTFDKDAVWATNYTYDGEGRRVKKVRNTETGPVTTTFVYDAMGKLVSEYETNTGASERGIRYVTADTLGSTRVVTDGSKVVKTRGAATLAVKARYDYLPFGEEIASSIGGRNVIPGYVTSDTTRQKFTSKERDSETGLDYFGARYYASVQGRFTSPDEFTGGAHEVSAGVLSPDPLLYAEPTEPESFNKYSYCLNNPLRYIDPDGHQTTQADRLATALSGAPSPGAAQTTYDIGAGVLKTVANMGIGIANFSHDYLNGDDKHIEPYQGSNVNQRLSMAATEDVAVFGGLAGGGGPATVMTAEAEETSVIAAEVGSVERATVRGVKQGGAITEPNPAPSGTLVKERGVTVERYSGDHGPPHAHVSGRGPNIRIGQNGNPLRNNPELSAAQRSVVQNNLKTIRNALGQAMKVYRYNRQ